VGPGYDANPVPCGYRRDFFPSASVLLCHDRGVSNLIPPDDFPPWLPADPAALADAVLDGDRRILLIGAPGVGKSTLADALAGVLERSDRTCRCVGADPGSPLFGVPGAICRGRREHGGWVLEDLQALCTLDAGRFRLPLVEALRKLVTMSEGGVLLIDGPGVVRGVAGAELLAALVEVTRIDVVLVLVRAGRLPPLREELHALSAAVYAIPAAEAAARPGSRARAHRRTALWEAYLGRAEDRVLELDGLRLIGTPPPVDVPQAWCGRQIALLDKGCTLALGEVSALEEGQLRVRLPNGTVPSRILLVRDAARLADGCLGSAARFTADRLEYLPPSDIAPDAPRAAATGPRPVGRVGMLSVCLVNGVFGDPLLHVRLRHRRRSLLFDLGEGARLPARVAHQVSDVFITHTHIDHIAGFVWLLRSRIGETTLCRLYGPPGLAENVDGLMRGILWDRVGERGPRFEVNELHGTRVLRYALRGGQPGAALLEERTVRDGVILDEPEFRVRAVTLEHISPVLAYALKPASTLNIRKDRLRARGLPPGPWLGELKRRVQEKEGDTRIRLPDGTRDTARALANDLVFVTPGKTLIYATDFADSPENRARVVELARGAHTLFCESTFRQGDAGQAARTAHLTTRACAEIAEAAGVARLVPFHFSRRYEKDPASVYAEIVEEFPSVMIPGMLAAD
jgi:ribonuclease Z